LTLENFTEFLSQPKNIFFLFNLSHLVAYMHYITHFKYTIFGAKIILTSQENAVAAITFSGETLSRFPQVSNVYACNHYMLE
jgi:hypothetical protein